MTILITGGTGKTGLAVAKLLHASNHSFLIASRSGTAHENFPAVKFDWLDESTWEHPFADNSNIDRVYLVAPILNDASPTVKKFIDLGLSKGVKRFVFMSGSAFERSLSSYGKIHDYLVDTGVDYAVIRPTWFFENFAVTYYASIRDQNEVFSLTKDGRVPLVSVEDVAEVAYNALVTEKSPNTDQFVLGPELFTYDEAVGLLSEVIGRKITHKRLSHGEERAILESFGMPPDYAKLYSTIEGRIADGDEEARVGNPKAVVGKKRLRAYLEANKDVWIV